MEEVGLAVAPTAPVPTTLPYPPVPALKECFAFALPCLGIYSAGPLMSLIDASFVGKASSVELAALGPASSVSDMASMPLIFLAIGATNLVATSSAAGDRRASAVTAQVGLALGLAGGTLIGALLLLFVGPISSLYCAGSAALTPPCAQYVAIRALALPAVVVAMVAQGAHACLQP